MNQTALPKITVLGTGTFGTAMAQVATYSGRYSAVMWGRDEQVIESINTKSSNPKAFPEIKLNEGITATTNLGDALKDTVMILGCLPAQVLPVVLENNKDKIPLDVPFVSCAKGMIVAKEKFLSEVVEEIYQGKMRYCILSGPSFAKEIMEKNPTVVVIASKDKEARESVQQMLSSLYFRSYTQEDVLGVEVAGALKNVLAIGAGAIEGMGYGINSVSAFISRGIKEILDFAKIYHADPKTFFGLAGIGDLMLTSFGSLSRNRSFGSRLGKGETIEEILKTSGVVEGVPTLNVVIEYAKKHNISMPLVSTLHNLVYGKITRQEALERIMLRDFEHEWHNFDYDETTLKSGAKGSRGSLDAV